MPKTRITRAGVSTASTQSVLGWAFHAKIANPLASKTNPAVAAGTESFASTPPIRGAAATAAPPAPKTSPKDVLARAKKEGVQIVDLRFVDLPGTWQHFSIPVEELSEGLFEGGIGFDGSSIRGFQHIHESDMLLMPDAT